MEHSLLHGLQLCGIVTVIGGPVLMLGMVFPALRRIGPGPKPALADALAVSVERWTAYGALLGALAALLNVLVDVAELDNRTIFGGVDAGTILRFIHVTTVGHFSLARLAALLLALIAVRLRGQWKWWLVLACSLAAAIFTGMVSHAAASPDDRLTAIATELCHIAAAGAWLGVLLHLVLARNLIESATDAPGAALVAQIIKRFSPVALAAVSVLMLSGVLAAARLLATAAAVPTSAYGLTLLVKMALLLPLLFAGFINYRFIRPALNVPQQQPTGAAQEARGRLLRRFGKMLELEVTAGVLVITVAGILASVSPPGPKGELRLTAAQRCALLSPALPTTQVSNPAAFYGARERTLNDLRYAEFMHNWSGVMVCVLGLCWLAQSLGGRAGKSAANIWPVCMIPFALFVAVGSDPEIWLLRKVSILQAIGDPTLFEHQLGAVLVLILAWLGWRDRRRPSLDRPLGYALPVMLILGSLMLLGHAHSNLAASQELTNLINVQHAIFGTFGLFAGIIRWLNLRGLFPDRIARFAWPSLVVGLGLFMAFFYREVV